MITHNLCFEKKCEKYQIFLSEKFPFLVVKFSIYLNRCVFIMKHTSVDTLFIWDYVCQLEANIWLFTHS